MKVVRGLHFQEVDISDWHVQSADSLGRAVDRAVKIAAGEALSVVLQSTETRLWLPSIYGDGDGLGNPPVDDPLTIYLSIPLSPSPDNCPVFACTLSEVIEDAMEDTVGEDWEAMLKVSAALRLLADRIDEEHRGRA